MYVHVPNILRSLLFVPRNATQLRLMPLHIDIQLAPLAVGDAFDGIRFISCSNPRREWRRYSGISQYGLNPTLTRNLNYLSTAVHFMQ